MDQRVHTAKIVERAVARLAFDVSTLVSDGVVDLDDFDAHIRPRVEALICPINDKKPHREV